MSDVVSVLGGTGALGRALALRLARSGRPVVLGSREAARACATTSELRALLGEVGVDGRIEGAGNAEAAADICTERDSLPPESAQRQFHG